MSELQSSEPTDQPGKTRTMWHPLLVRLLAYSLDSAYKVEQEVSVGKMPLRVDILLIRRERGELSEAKARNVAELLPLLGRFTLIEFKGPTDAIEPGDFAAARRLFVPLAQSARRAAFPRRDLAHRRRAGGQCRISRRLTALGL